MNWRFKALALVFAIAAATSGPARAQEEGGEEEGEKSTKTIDANFASQSDANSSGAGVTYTVPLTETLKFSTTTNLSNGYSAVDQSVSRNRDTSLAIDYDPASPWRMQVSYANAYNLFRRPASEVYDEFKTETSSNSLNSLVNYDYSDDLKTGLNLTAEENSNRVIIAEGTVPPPTHSRKNSYSGNVDYNLTKSTSLALAYSGGFDFSKMEVSRTRTFPPRPIKIMESRKRSDTLNGSLRFGKDVTDTLNLSVNVTGNKNLTHSNDLEGAEDADTFDTNGMSAVTWKPLEILTITNSTTITRGKNLYPHKYEYLRYLNTSLFDRYSRAFGDTAALSMKPSGTSELGISGDYSESETIYRGINNELPDKVTAPEAAGQCLNTVNAKVGGNVDISIGQNITFHMMYQRFDTYYKYLVRKVAREKNYSVSSNTLNSNIGFDWTKDLRVDVATGMNQYRNRYDYEATDDTDNLDVNLKTDFYYDVTPVTDLEFHVGIGKTATTYPDPNVTVSESARITRSFSTVARREFGKIFKPGCTFGMDLARSYFPSSLEMNAKDDTWYITPSADFVTSDALTITLSYNYSNHIYDKTVTPVPEDWTQYLNHATSASVTYAPTTALTLSLGATNTHNIIIKNRLHHFKEIPAESYFNMNAGAGFNF